MDLLRDMMPGDVKIFTKGQLAPYTINADKRARPVLAHKVDELIESIKRMGILQPIICSTDIGGDTAKLDLIVGAHRLAAIRKLWATSATPQEWTLPIRIVSLAPGEARRLVELSENFHRNELSDDQRRDFARLWMRAEIKRKDAEQATVGIPSQRDGIPTSKPKKAVPEGPGRGNPKSLLVRWSEKDGRSRTTVFRLWDEFCKDRGRTVKATDATTDDMNAFLEWITVKDAGDKQANAQVQQTVKAEKEAKVELFRVELTKISRKTGRTENSIKPLWRKYWFDQTGGEHVKPSDGTAAQWAEFANWIVTPEAQGGPKPPKSPVLLADPEQEGYLRGLRAALEAVEAVAGSQAYADAIRALLDAESEEE